MYLTAVTLSPALYATNAVLKSNARNFVNSLSFEVAMLRWGLACWFAPIVTMFRSLFMRALLSKTTQRLLEILDRPFHRTSNFDIVVKTGD